MYFDNIIYFCHSIFSVFNDINFVLITRQFLCFSYLSKNFTNTPRSSSQQWTLIIFHLKEILLFRGTTQYKNEIYLLLQVWDCFVLTNKHNTILILKCSFYLDCFSVYTIYCKIYLSARRFIVLVLHTLRSTRKAMHICQ